MSRFFTVAIVTLACQSTPFSSASTDPDRDGSMADGSPGGGTTGDASVGAGGAAGSPARGGSSGSQTGGTSAGGSNNDGGGAGMPGSGGDAGVTGRDAASAEDGSVSCATPPRPDDRVYAEVMSDGLPFDDFIYLDLYVTNGANQALPLGAIEIRYYFTSEPVTESIVELMFAAQYDDYLPGGYVEHDPALVQASIVDTVVVPGADHYVSIIFADAAGTLNPGGQLEVSLSVHLPDYAANYDETDDYSFSGCSSSLVIEDGIVVLGDGGAILFGTPPNP